MTDDLSPEVERAECLGGPTDSCGRADDEFVMWHHYRPWNNGFYNDYPRPPCGVAEPCGDCGQARSGHPLPALRDRRGAVVWEFLRLREAAHG